MKRALLGNHSLYACSFLQSSFKFNANHPNIVSVRLASLTRRRLRFYSSESDSSNSVRSIVDVEDVSNEELKRRIEKYLEGDEEAIPSIFEAILSRKLAGKHEESDDELMKEIRQTTSNGVRHDEVDSDEDS